MEAMDVRRLELYDLRKPMLGEERTRRLVLALPAAPERLLTEEFFSAELDTRLAEQTDKLAWRMITIMGAWTVAATWMFAFLSQLFQR
jgi:hypothetical protein